MTEFDEEASWDRMKNIWWTSKVTLIASVLPDDGLLGSIIGY